MLRFADLFNPDRPLRVAATVWTRELSELARALESNETYFHELAQTMSQNLQNGRRQTVTPRSKTDVIGATFQQYVHTMNALEEYLEQITSGNLRISIPKDVTEIKLMKSFRTMIIEIRRAIDNMRREASHVASISSKVAAMSQQGSRNAEMEAQSIENISLSFHQVAENLREVIENISIQSHSFDDTFTAVESMLSSIENINVTIDSLSSASKEMSHSVDEIHGFMQEIESHAQSSAEISIRQKKGYMLLLRSSKVSKLLKIPCRMPQQRSND
jgi:methyl-accepting chemotaxis protein